MSAYEDVAVCVRHWDWSETSQTVSLFSRGHGLVRALAKGSKRERSRFSGGIELLTLGAMGAIPKRDDSMTLLTSWDLLRTFPGPRASLQGFRMGMYFAELVQHLVIDVDPHEELFDALVAALDALADASRIEHAVLGFQWAGLGATGHRPDLNVEGATGRQGSQPRVVGFAPRRGRFVTIDRASPEGDPVWPVRFETWRALRGIAQMEESAPAPTPEAIHRANLLLASYIREIVGRDLPAQCDAYPALRPKGGDGPRVKTPRLQADAERAIP